jgi:hypothetical protein
VFGYDTVREDSMTITRGAGTALLVYGIGTTVGYFGAGGPGGDFEPATIAGYTAPSHYPVAVGLWYLGGLAALALVPFARELRSLGGWLGETLWGLGIAASCTSVVGAFLGGGLVTALWEGGPSVQQGLPQPVVYALSEVANLMALCGPAFFVGAAAVLLGVRGPLPAWLRVFSVVAGVCGILLPFYFTIPVYLLWVLVLGIRAVVRGAREARPTQARLHASRD